MKRGMIWGLVGAGLACVGLAIALVLVGSQLDAARLDRDDAVAERDELGAEREMLAHEADTLRTDHDNLKQQVEAHLHTIEQLKADVERARTQPSVSLPAASAVLAPAAASSTAP